MVLVFYVLIRKSFHTLILYKCLRMFYFALVLLVSFLKSLKKIFDHVEFILG